MLQIFLGSSAFPARALGTSLRGCFLLTLLGSPLRAQIQIRLGDSTRANYSELHEALREGTAEADSVAKILGEKSARVLWKRVHSAFKGASDWDHGLIALTRIAELADPGSVDSAVKLRKRIEAETLRLPPTRDPADLLPALHAIELERARATRGDAGILRDLLTRIPSGDYDLSDAWVLGRLGGGAADTIAARFLAESDPGLKIRYLTLLSFSTDTSLIPLLSRIYLAPDSFGLPLRIGVRASDGLLWIGTRRSLQALLEARSAARRRGTYADPRLGHADLDFLGSDSSAVISRTGRWLEEWVARLH